MDPGIRRRETKNQDDPRIVPGGTAVVDLRRVAQIVLVLAFLLFDLIGLALIFFPGAQVIAQRPVDEPHSTPAHATSPRIAGASPAPTNVPQGSQSNDAPIATLATPSLPPPTRTLIPTSQASPPASQLLPGIYVTGLRFDPPAPARNQEFHFYVTFLNTTDQPQAVRWDVFAFRPSNLQQRFGQSLPVGKGDIISTGSHEVRSFGTYKLFGGGGCEQVVFRIGRIEDGQPLTYIDQPDGRPMLQAVTLCP